MFVEFDSLSAGHTFGDGLDGLPGVKGRADAAKLDSDIDRHGAPILKENAIRDNSISRVKRERETNEWCGRVGGRVGGDFGVIVF